MPPTTLSIHFFMTDAGTEPVRDWLKSLPIADRKRIENGKMVLLHGFIKKSQHTPLTDLRIAKQRMK